MQLSSESLEADVQRRAVTRGWHALALVVFGVGLLGTVAAFMMLSRVGTALSHVFSPASRASHCDGCQPAPQGSAVWRAGYMVGVIQQVAVPRAGRSLTMFLTKMSSSGSTRVLDSAYAGHLVARLDQDRSSVVWTIDFVPRDSVRGVTVGRLVVGSGHPPLPVWGDSASRP